MDYPHTHSAPDVRPQGQSPRQAGQPDYPPLLCADLSAASCYLGGLSVLLRNPTAEERRSGAAILGRLADLLRAHAAALGESAGDDGPPPEVPPQVLSASRQLAQAVLRLAEASSRTEAPPTSEVP